MDERTATKLRRVADELLELRMYEESSATYAAVRHIESLEQKVLELEGMLQDAEHFRDHWFNRVYPQKAVSK